MNRSNVLLKVILVAIIFATSIISTSNSGSESSLLENANLSETVSEFNQKSITRYISIKDSQQIMLRYFMPIPTG